MDIIFHLSIKRTSYTLKRAALAEFMVAWLNSYLLGDAQKDLPGRPIEQTASTTLWKCQLALDILLKNADFSLQFLRLKGKTIIIRNIEPRGW